MTDEQQRAEAAAAELKTWQDALKGLARNARSIKTAIQGYGPDDVELYDVTSGNCNVLMNQVRAKLSDYTEWIDGLLDDGIRIFSSNIFDTHSPACTTH